MFGTSQGTVDQALERRRLARRCAARGAVERVARATQLLTEIVREAEDDGDFKAAGCTSGAQWLAQITSSDHSTAKRITQTATALRDLPALDAAMRTGELNLDQVAAASQFATPETDAELARIAVGQTPSAIELAARTLTPPKVMDDQELYQRRSLSMAWTNGRRELAISGRLPLEQGLAFEQAIWDIAKAGRAEAKMHGAPLLEWPQYTADALVTLATRDGVADSGVKRSPVTVVVHLSADEPAFVEGAGPISPETADRLACDARRLELKPSGRDLVHSHLTRCASEPQLRALHKRSKHCQYPGCSAIRELAAHHLTHAWRGGKTELANLILLCPRHHKLIHDHHIATSGAGKQPAFTDRAGRAITTDQPHAPPR